MAIDVNTLKLAEHNQVRMNGSVTMHIWQAEAYGVRISYQTLDLDAKFWVSPILTMRQEGVALVDCTGQMVKNERRSR